VNSDPQSKERFMERYKKYNVQKFNIESKRLKKSNNTKSRDITCASQITKEKTFKIFQAE
jgi:hypothetical protein